MNGAPTLVSSTHVPILLVASVFPPFVGGSAVVYGSLCDHLPVGSIAVLTPTHHHLDKRAIAGAQEHDLNVPYTVHRIRLLRPPSHGPSASILESVRRRLVHDLPVQARVLWSVVRLLRRYRVKTVCIGELGACGWLAVTLKALFNCQVIIYVHGEEVTTRAVQRFGGDRRKAYLAAADKVVAVSSFTRQSLQQLMGVPPQKVYLIPNGVDTAKFKPGLPDDAYLQRLGIWGRPIVLTVGRLVPRKGIDMAIRAMQQVRREHALVRHVIVGDGPMRAELVELIRTLDLDDTVMLTGALPFAEVLKLFQACDVFLMPNRTMPDGDTEGFGLVFLEANACGKPVIGGRAGGAQDAIIDGQTGLLVEGQDSNEIAGAVNALLSDEAMRRRLGQQGLDHSNANCIADVAHRFGQVCGLGLRL